MYVLCIFIYGRRANCQTTWTPTYIYIYFQYITLCLSLYASSVSCFINAATTVTFAFKDNNKSHKTTAKTTATYTESIFIYIKLKIYF